MKHFNSQFLMVDGQQTEQHNLIIPTKASLIHLQGENKQYNMESIHHLQGLSIFLNNPQQHSPFTILAFQLIIKILLPL